MPFVTHEQAVARSIAFLGGAEAEDARPLIVLVHARSVAAELERRLAQLADASVELARLREVEAAARALSDSWGQAGVTFREGLYLAELRAALQAGA